MEYGAEIREEAVIGMKWEKTVTELRGRVHGTRQRGQRRACHRLYKFSWVAGVSPERESRKQK